MNPRHILITGGTGLLALNWACAMRERAAVTLGTHDHRVRLGGTSSAPLNLSHPIELRRAIGQIKPDLIVHTAALTNVEICEERSADAHHVNAEIAGHVAAVAAEARIRLIHISTDHLFPGTAPFQTELSTPEPMNEYARTKLLAERLVQERHPDALILRTNFFCWGHALRQSFSDWIIHGLESGKALPLFDDVFYTPILADALIDAAHELLNQGAVGIFNAVGGERISKYEFGVRLAAAFNFPTELICASHMPKANLRVARPMDMSLSNKKLMQTIGRDVGSLEAWFADLQRQEKQGRRGELEHAVYK